MELTRKGNYLIVNLFYLTVSINNQICFQQRGLNVNVDLLAEGVFVNGRHSMMIIMLNFSEQLIGVGFSFNAFLMIATVTLFQIAISFWCLAVDSTSNNNRRIFKWQCLLTTFAAAICLLTRHQLTQDGTFF